MATAAAADSPGARAIPLRRQLLLLAGAVLWLLALLALLTHASTDPGFSTSGGGQALRNKAGLLGAWTSDFALFLLGHSVWWLPLVAARALLSTLARELRGQAAPQARPAGFWLGLVMLLAASAALEWTRLYRFETVLPGHAGGVLGYTLGPLSIKWLGFAGSGVLWITALLAGMALALRFSWLRTADAVGTWIDSQKERREVKRERVEDLRLGQQAQREREQVAEVERLTIQDHVPIVIEPTLAEVPKSTRVAKERQTPLFSELSDAKLPQVDLLDAAPGRVESVAPETLEMTSRLIEKKLKDFGVEVRVVAASPGPVITRYEIEPATGVKGSQIVNLVKDLARAFSVISIRVVETIPGKSCMGLEIPNPKRQVVRLHEIVSSKVYADLASPLTIAMGKDIAGKPVCADLAKMPHVLVAGTTGSGKSVAINAMILSLLYKATPNEVRLILVDPKMLELSVYEGIPHLLAPVVVDMKQAAYALTWCVAEMERRYKLMSSLGVRNLSGFNQKLRDAEKAGNPITNPFTITPEAPEPLSELPMIVVVIDELADLMMVVGKKVEELIARLAQKARAAGIHLVLATQRPSVDVITGLIKANIPTRVAFQVSSKIDSRTILDQMGAEALLGQGDMLYLPPGTGFPVRVHGAYVGDDEVHRVVEYLKSRGQPQYIEGMLDAGEAEEGGEGGAAGGAAGGESDALYDEAVAIVLKNRRASISLVQRHLRIGYNRAARLIEQMERSGLVSSMATNGNREILVPARSE